MGFFRGFVMSTDWSLQKNLALLIAAFRGARTTRIEHRQALNSPVTVETGLAALRQRWPDLESPSEAAPVFILSAGWRSGSTLLQRWIMTGGDILVWGEPYGYAGLIPSLAGQLKAFTQSWPHDGFFAASHDHGEDLTKVWVANLYPCLRDFMDAHIAYFENLFLKPALTNGKERWGLKEVRLGVQHACYLQWLFPNAKFLFLYRNPYHAYASYRKWGGWYRKWPEEPIFTAARFGAVWKELTSDFLENHQKVGGLLLRYEELRSQATRSRIEEYIGARIAEPSSLARVPDAYTADRGKTRPRWIPKLETYLLKRQVEPLSVQLGYPTGVS